MEEKHFSLKLSIVLSVVIVLLIGVGFYAYSKQPTTEEEVRQIELLNGVCANSQDFVIFKKGRFTHGGLYILVDKKTRVQYLYFSNGYQGGMSALIDSLGKPILYQGERITNGSNFKWAINTDNASQNIKVTLDKSSTWTLTADTYITSLNNAVSDNSNINLNGHKLVIANS